MRKGWINELFSKPKPELNAGNNKEYKFETIIDSAVYIKKAERHLPALYYLVSWKGYPAEKSTWEPFSIVMHLWKIISTFHKDHPEKPAVTSPPLNSAPPMTKPSVKPAKPSTKQKQSRLTNLTK